MSPRARVSRRELTHLAVGSDGGVYLNVEDLRPEHLAELQRRGRRVFTGVELEGKELAVARAEMNDAGAFNAAVAIVEVLPKPRPARSRRH